MEFLRLLRIVWVIVEIAFALANIWGRWVLYVLFIKTFNLPDPDYWISNFALTSLNFSQVLTICFVTGVVIGLLCSVLKVIGFIHGELSVVRLRLSISQRLLNLSGDSSQLDSYCIAEMIGPKSQQIRQYLAVDLWWQEFNLIRAALDVVAAVILSWSLGIAFVGAVIALAVRAIYEAKVVQKAFQTYDSALSAWLHQILDVSGGRELIFLNGSSNEELRELTKQAQEIMMILHNVVPKNFIGVFAAAVIVNLIWPCVFLIAYMTNGDFQVFFLITNLLADAHGGYDNYTSLIHSQNDCIRAQQFIEESLRERNNSFKEPQNHSETSISIEEKELLEMDEIVVGGNKDSGIVLRDLQLGYYIHPSLSDPLDSSSKLSEGYFKTILRADVSFPLGSVVGIIGESGSGKSTLLRSICGLLKPSRGIIMVEGQNIYEELDSWHSQISVIPQDCYLFNRTIQHNITFGNANFNNDSIIDSANKAQVLQFTSKFKDGLDTMVETGGRNLSGGQKQRIHMARALLKRSRFLFFDEPVR
jgi:ABC-type multidrug transport system fused ATPase/permease subunit